MWRKWFLNGLRWEVYLFFIRVNSILCSRKMLPNSPQCRGQPSPQRMSIVLRLKNPGLWEAKGCLLLGWRLWPSPPLGGSIRAGSPSSPTPALDHHMTFPLALTSPIHKMGTSGWCEMRWVGKNRTGYTWMMSPVQDQAQLRRFSASKVPGISSASVLP